MLLTLANELHGRGHPVGLLVLDGAGPLRPLLAPGLRHYDLRQPRLRAAIGELIGFFRRLGPARVISSFGYVNLALAAAKPLLHRGTRLYFREANLPSLSLPQQPYPALMRFGYRWLYPLSERVVATSQRMADEFLRDFRIPAGKLVTIPNPVDVERLRQVRPQRQPGAGLRFVAAGRLTHQKGFDRLLPLLADLPQDWHLTLLGDGPQLMALQQQAAQLNISERVAFAGFRDDAVAWIAGADALLLPSRWEGMPNAALEALAVGTPVVATPDAGGLAEVAADATPDAILLPPFGSAYFAALGRVRENPPPADLRPSLLPARFDLAAVAETWEHLLQEPAP